jgi:peroxiredoxin (alkyl hydroperoxide reductase subunit C)
MLSIEQPAPQFSAQSVCDGGEIKSLSLSDYRGQWVILFFYPLDFTFVCPTELTQFRELLPEFTKINASVLAISVDSPHSHKRWLRDDLGNLGFPLVSDITKRISRDYKVLLESQGFATRGTFILDPAQNIQYIGIHNTAVGRDAKEILRVLQALQSGELCPAGWRKGDQHMVSLR